MPDLQWSRLRRCAIGYAGILREMRGARSFHEHQPRKRRQLGLKVTPRVYKLTKQPTR